MRSDHQRKWIFRFFFVAKNAFELSSLEVELTYHSMQPHVGLQSIDKVPAAR
jgi:hypothetical protein